MKKQNPLGLVVGILIFTIGMLALAKACQENRGQTREPDDDAKIRFDTSAFGIQRELFGMLTNKFFPANSPFQFHIGDGPGLRLLSLATNRFTNILSLVRVEPDTNICAVCGATHHERHIVAKIARESLMLFTELDGQTRSNVVWEAPARTWIETDIVQRTFHRQQPGALPPTPPPLTNAPTTWIDHDPIGRTMVSAVEDGKLAAHEEWKGR